MNKTTLITIGVVIVISIAFLQLKPKSNTTQTASNTSVAATQTNVVKPAEPQAVTNNQESTSIELESGAFFFKPNVITTQAGEIDIKVTKNQGLHTFVIDELDVNQRIVEGENITFSAPPGTYTYYCDIPGHRENGQEGTLIVN